jgi:hypothetical protein
MKNVHVVMPFSRPYMIEELIRIFGKERLNLLIFENQVFECSSDWPIPIIVSYQKVKEDICYHKINQFIKTNIIVDDDYYWCMCDDDSIEDGVLSAIENMNNDITFISMKRGDAVPEGLPLLSQHPTNTLYANPESICIGGIGLEQMIIKGKIFKKLLFNVRSHTADGQMAMFLKDRYPIKYEPNLFVLFNYFQEGRWNK